MSCSASPSAAAGLVRGERRNLRRRGCGAVGGSWPKGLEITLRPQKTLAFGWAGTVAVRIGPGCEDAEPALEALRGMLGAVMAGKARVSRPTRARAGQAKDHLPESRRG